MFLLCMLLAIRVLLVLDGAAFARHLVNTVVVTIQHLLLTAQTVHAEFGSQPE